MIELLAALALQSISELPVLTIPRQCPEDAENCVMVYAEWDATSANLPIEFTPLNEIQMVGSFERIDYFGLTSVLRGNLAGGDMGRYEIRFQNGIDVYSPCGGLGYTSTIWPLLGYSPGGNPIIRTSEGEFEIVSEEPEFGWSAQLIVVDLETLDIITRVPLISDWDTYLYGEDGSVYLQLRDRSCFIVPVNLDRRYERQDQAICESLHANGGLPIAVTIEDPTHPANLDFEFADRDYGSVHTDWPRVSRVANIPDRLILDVRMPCT
jgi:hypothetical protein